MRGVEPTTHCRMYQSDRDRLMMLTAAKNGYRSGRGEKRWYSADAIRGLISANIELRGKLADQAQYHAVEMARLVRENRELKEKLAKKLKLVTV